MKLLFYDSKSKPIFFKFRSSPTYVLVTVSIAMFVNLLTYSLIVPIVPFVVDALDRGLPVDSVRNPYDSSLQNNSQTAQKTSIILIMFAIGLLIASPIFGYMGDRISRRKIPMLIGISGIIAATLIFLFITQYYQFLIARFLQGVADSSVWVLGMALIADAFPFEELGQKMGIVMFCYSAGLVAGAPVGGALYTAFGYKAPFILVVVLAGIDFFLRLCMIEKKDCLPEWVEVQKKEDETSVKIADDNQISSEEEKTIGIDHEKQDNEPTTTVAAPTGEDVQEEETVVVKGTVSFWTLMKHPRLISAALLAFANGTVYNVFEPTLTIKLSSDFGLNSSQIGLVFLAQMVPTFVSAPLSGWACDRYGPKIVCLITMPLCAVFMILMGTQGKDSPGGVAPLIVLFSLQGLTCFAFVTPALPEIAHVAQTEGAKVGDTGTGRAYSVFNCAFALGAVVGPILGGYLFGQIGFFYMCVVMGCFVLVCVPYIFFFIGEPGKIIDYKPKKKSENDALSSISVSNS